MSVEKLSTENSPEGATTSAGLFRCVSVVRGVYPPLANQRAYWDVVIHVKESAVHRNGGPCAPDQRSYILPTIHHVLAKGQAGGVVILGEKPTARTATLLMRFWMIVYPSNSVFSIYLYTMEAASARVARSPGAEAPAFRVAVEDVRPLAQRHALLGPRGNLPLVPEGDRVVDSGELLAGAPGEVLHHHRHLLAGDSPVRPEGVVFVARGDPWFQKPNSRKGFAPVSQCLHL